jgi:glycosyltransferase involved in cell wall biosynthesis
MPKILYLVTEDWFFASHFLPMARAAREAGLDVAVATRIDRHQEAISAEGCRLIAYDSSRSSVSVLRGLRELRQMLSIVRREQPDIVHCIALRPVVFGGLVARCLGIKAVVLAPTGLGHLWIEDGFGVRALRAVVRFVVGTILRGPRTRYLFENRDDPAVFGLDPDGGNVTIVGGAGVDPAQFPASPEPPAPPVKFAVVARMIRPKGIAEAVEAIARARAGGVQAELHLFGASDPSNRSAIPDDVLRAWCAKPGIRWHAHVDDVARVWREHHAALLLTYREGMPRALVEAAAAGRPIIATDVPGCREVVRNGQEGLLVPARDVAAAASAIETLAGDAALRARLGAAAHARFQSLFTEEAVKRVVSNLYASLLRRSPAEGPPG